MNISKKLQSCAQSPMRAFHPYAVEAKSRGTRIYHLNIGQPDIPTPDAFFDALREFDAPVLEYAASPGIDLLAKATLQYYERLGMNYSNDEILITSGGSEALSFLMLSILDEGDNVIVFEPFYPNYSTFIKMAGGEVKSYVTKAEEGYRFTSREKLESLIDEKTRAIIVTNPSNPTGVVFTFDELRTIADVAKEHGLYLIGDEVYREFIYSDKPIVSVGQFDDIAQNAIIVDSVSKRFSACGARVGSIVSKNKPLMQQLLKLCQGRLAVATIEQIACAKLYSIDESYYNSVRDEYRKRRDIVMQKLREIPGVLCEEPEGAFYIMASLPIADAKDFQLFLLNEFSHDGETVMLSPGEGFYASSGAGKNEIRIAYVLNSKDLERAMELLKMAIVAYNDLKKD